MVAKYKLLYCAKIDDEKHADMLKIGDTDFEATKPLDKYSPNEDVLKKAAKDRIRQWGGTAAVGAELVYCETLVIKNNQTNQYESFRDGKVHTVLQNVGFPKIEFNSDMDSGREWFKVDLPTVIVAIKAAKEDRDYLDTSELPQKEIYILRDEQKKAVDATIDRYKKNDDMLWHAKMRFGKTISALNLVKREGYKRTIIITHRPVVEDSWGSDFYHVFTQKDKFVFLTKMQNVDMVPEDGEFGEVIDKANDDRLQKLADNDGNFVYFASIQDLRGSKRVNPNGFEKNNVVFDLNWDLVIIDEAHEGTKTELGQQVINLLVKNGTKKLDLSGTAYNLFDKYTEKGSIFTWDYVMEQQAKRDWEKNHPNKKNPYEDMPVMHINTFDLKNALQAQGLYLSDRTFSFREFFRTWTGALSKDGEQVSSDAIGKFVHEKDVVHFLDLLINNGGETGFPYATKDQCKNNHSLWMVPGVKEAAALSALLKKHKIFGNENLFGIANVAGEGDHDEEKNYNNALSLVRKTIEKYPNSITLSCGRLTTGVTVKEWSTVFMLSGSDTTDAKNYMQTIFRVQSAGKIAGVQKKDAYVYDFAPDRTLLVIAESVLGSRKGKKGTVVGDDEQHKEFEDFLKFCPVVSIDGAKFEPFGVESLISQINRVQIDRALRTGFTDNGIYDMSRFKELDADDINKMNAIFKKLKETKSKKPLSQAGMANNGTGKDGSSKKATKGHGKNNNKKEQKEIEKNIIEKLRTISIRIPLLFFGGDFQIEDGRLAEMVTSIDPVSWRVFMPEHLSVADFKELAKYYNQETVIGAAKIIKSKAKEADKLPPTERVIAITEIFSHFHNPSKETVLTPWRVVNMHMTDTLGGWCFYNEKFEENTDEYYHRLPEPRFVDNGQVTSDVLMNPSAKVLEINSKSGLYPLFVTYNLYRAKLGNKKESDYKLDELQSIWDEAAQQVYVLCQSRMAASITKHTLFGDRNVNNNIIFDNKFLDKLKNSPSNTAKIILKGSYWKKKVKKMKFDAVVGNPPYQVMDGGGKGYSAIPIYNVFVDSAKKLKPHFISMITPSRWFSGGKGLDEFRERMLTDERLSKIVDYIDNEMLFKGVDIAGGVNYFLWDRDHSGNCEFTSIRGEFRNTMMRNLQEYDILVRNNAALRLIRRLQDDDSKKMNDVVYTRNVFGISSDYRGKTEYDSVNNIKLYSSDKSNSMTATFISPNEVQKEKQLIPKYKVIMGKVVPRGGEVGIDPSIGYRAITTVQVLYPNSVFTDSYLLLSTSDNEVEAINFAKYMTLRFPRFLLHETYSSMNISKSNFRFVPYLDYTQEWSDTQLFTLFQCNEEEIQMVKSMMRPLEYILHKETGQEKHSIYSET